MIDLIQVLNHDRNMPKANIWSREMITTVT